MFCLLHVVQPSGYNFTQLNIKKNTRERKIIKKKKNKNQTETYKAKQNFRELYKLDFNRFTTQLNFDCC